jgi:hypothetical protein
MVYISCAETNYSKVDCHQIEKMSIQDQLYRGDKKCNPIVHIVDSLSKGDTAFYSEFQEQATNIYIDRKETTFTKGFIDKVTSDSLRKLQLEIDRIQVREVSAWLENIEQNRMDTLPCYFDILFILAHTPSEMRNEVRALVNNKKKFISFETYEYLNRMLDKKKAKICR